MTEFFYQATVMALIAALIIREGLHYLERQASRAREDRLIERVTGVRFQPRPPVDRHWDDRKEAANARVRAEKAGRG